MSIWKADEWNYRITSRRSVLIKNKRNDQRKLLVVDIETRLPFLLEVPENMPMDSMKTGKEYVVTMKIHTAKRAENVNADLLDLFQVLDVDQPAESFLSATCCYPNLIRFELEDIETQEQPA